MWRRSCIHLLFWSSWLFNLILVFLQKRNTGDPNDAFCRQNILTLLSIFRNNLFINSLLLLPYVILVRVHTLVHPVAYEVQQGDTFVVEFLFSSISSPIGQSISAILLVYLQAVFLNRLVIKHRLAPDYSLWPGLIYILLTLMPSFPGLSPHLLANTFILISLDQLFRTYKSPKVADN